MNELRACQPTETISYVLQKQNFKTHELLRVNIFEVFFKRRETVLFFDQTKLYQVPKNLFLVSLMKFFFFD